jgi:hypothetical protein
MFDHDYITYQMDEVVGAHDLRQHFAGIEIFVMGRVVLYIRMQPYSVY